jgi:hypothetical protein
MVFEFCVWGWRGWDGACEESKGRSQDWEMNGKRIREDNVNWMALLCVGSSYTPTFQECPPPIGVNQCKAQFEPYHKLKHTYDNGFANYSLSHRSLQGNLESFKSVRGY